MKQYLFDTYGPTMGIKDLSQVMKMTTDSIHNAIRLGRFPIPTKLTGKYRLAKTEDVANYFDNQPQQNGGKT